MAGAHNQRGMVTVKLRFQKFFWIEDVIRLVEDSASGEVYSLLKRIDEKYVTEKAYENPLFVEDVVRNVALRLNRIDNFTWYSVEAENLESTTTTALTPTWRRNDMKGKGGKSFFNLYHQGFIRTAVCVPDVKVGDPYFNTDRTIETAREAARGKAVFALFPELACPPIPMKIFSTRRPS